MHDGEKMPLKAFLDGQPVLAPLLNDREWAELYFQRYRLTLPCCPGVAVQMRGGAGTARELGRRGGGSRVRTSLSQPAGHGQRDRAAPGRSYPYRKCHTRRLAFGRATKFGAE